MTVSIIIPTYNEENVIGDCLESLEKQTFRDFEVIVVDDGSVDTTVSKIKNQNAKIKILQQKHKGPGAARNLGAKHTRGEILVFVDADMTFDSDFIKSLVAPLVAGKVKGTFSKEEYVANPENIWSICWGINEGWEAGRRHPKDYPETQKVFRAILKKEFDRVGGFDLTGYTDDWTLAEKLGYSAVASPGAKFYHRNPESLNEVFRQAHWIGKRQYKFGKIGTLVAILRSSTPVSLVVGMYKAILTVTPAFLVFKVFYDLGVFSGALQSIFGGNSAK